VSGFVDILNASGRATVIGVPEGQSTQEAARVFIEKEKRDKERIEKAGIPPGKHWWQLRDR